MEISINTAGATKRELLLVAGLFTSLADVTEYARTTESTPSPVIAHVDRPDVGAPEAPLPVSSVPAPPIDMAASFGHTPVPMTAIVPVAVPFVPPAPPMAPPVPISPVPSLPTVDTAPTDALDVRGLPWDDRIHSGSKAKNADGRWKARKGLNDPSLVARVEAELLGHALPARVAPVSPPPPPAYVPGAGAPVVPGHAASVPPVPPAPPAAVAAPAGMVADFQTLMAEVVKLMQVGKLDPALTQTLCHGVGVENLGLMGLPTNVAKIPALWAAIREQVGM